MLSFPIFNSLCRFSCWSKFAFKVWFSLFKSRLIRWVLPDAEGPAKIMSCLFEGVTVFAVVAAQWKFRWVVGWGALPRSMVLKLFYFGRRFWF